MKMIEAILRPERLAEIKDALNQFEVKGLTVTQVMGCGRQKGHREYYRGTMLDINLLPKIKIEIATQEQYADDIVRLISEKARTGEIGDCKIFIQNIEEAIRIRTGERGEDSI